MNKSSNKTIPTIFTFLAALVMGIAACNSAIAQQDGSGSGGPPPAGSGPGSGPGGPGQRWGGGGHGGQKTELGDKMKAMGKDLKQLKGQIGDATKQQSTVDLLESAKKNAGAAKKLTPVKAKEVPEAERPKFITDFQAEIDKLIGDLGKIEDAVKAGKYDDAKKLYGGLNQLKREGHEKFAPKED
jgi:soluble cytochrome b562